MKVCGKKGIPLYNEGCHFSCGIDFGCCSRRGNNCRLRSQTTHWYEGKGNPECWVMKQKQKPLRICDELLHKFKWTCLSILHFCSLRETVLETFGLKVCTLLETENDVIDHCHWEVTKHSVWTCHTNKQTNIFSFIPTLKRTCIQFPPRLLLFGQSCNILICVCRSFAQVGHRSTATLTTIWFLASLKQPTITRPNNSRTFTTIFGLIWWCKSGKAPDAFPRSIAALEEH